MFARAWIKAVLPILATATKNSTVDDFNSVVIAIKSLTIHIAMTMVIIATPTIILVTL